MMPKNVVVILCLLFFYVINAQYLDDVAFAIDDSTKKIPVKLNGIETFSPYSRKYEGYSRGLVNGIEKRDGYAYPANYPYAISFLEPLNILAGLAFLAYLIQALHALYVFHHPLPQPVATVPPTSSSLVGGLVDNLVPTRIRYIADEYNLEHILRAIQIYDLMLEKKKLDSYRIPYKTFASKKTSVRDPGVDPPRKK